MKYKLIQRINPQKRNEVKWYAIPVNDGKIEKDDIAQEIVAVSALGRGDVSDVIESVIDVVPKYLLMGKSVNLGELGTMRISFGSEGVDDPKKFHTSLISGVRIVFTPSVELKDALTKIHFEHDGKRPGEDEGGNEGGGSGESGGEEGGSEGGEDEGGGFVDPNA